MICSEEIKKGWSIIVGGYNFLCPQITPYEYPPTLCTGRSTSEYMVTYSSAQKLECNNGSQGTLALTRILKFLLMGIKGPCLIIRNQEHSCFWYGHQLTANLGTSIPFSGPQLISHILNACWDRLC